MKTACRVLASLILLSIAASAFAHEGHGNIMWVRSALHYIIEPEHLSVILPTALIALLIFWWRTHRVCSITRQPNPKLKRD